MDKCIEEAVDLNSLSDFDAGSIIFEQELLDPDFLSDFILSPIEIELPPESEVKEEKRSKRKAGKRRQRKRARKGTLEYLIERKKNNDSVRRSRLKKKEQEREKDEEIIRLRARINQLEDITDKCSRCQKLAERDEV